jgi:hypothetical protein
MDDYGNTHAGGLVIGATSGMAAGEPAGDERHWDLIKINETGLGWCQVTSTDGGIASGKWPEFTRAGRNKPVRSGDPRAGRVLREVPKCLPPTRASASPEPRIARARARAPARARAFFNALPGMRTRRARARLLRRLRLQCASVHADSKGTGGHGHGHGHGHGWGRGRTRDMGRPKNHCARFALLL